MTLREHFYAGHLVSRVTTGIGESTYKLEGTKVKEQDWEYSAMAGETWNCLSCRIEVIADQTDLNWFWDIYQ